MRKSFSILVKRILLLCLGLFLLMNIIACFHAYKFTHYAAQAAPLPRHPEQLALQQKVSAILFGVDLPRPQNQILPKRKFNTLWLNQGQLECWEIPVVKPKGIVILFHGYGNRKCGMLDRAEAFYQMGYQAVLPDFSGSGGSKGNTTTIGFKEADEVKICYDHYKQKFPGLPLYMLGTSMGAAAVLKCVNDYDIKPDALMLECPFGTMYSTVCNRFDAMQVPSFPMAGLLVFYGGLMNGFWAFDHNPTEYAKKVKCPVLLMSGGSDERVPLREIDEIYANLQGKKQKIIYPRSGHESYLNKYASEWKQDVSCFLEAK